MYYISKLSERYHMGTKGFAPEFIDSLIAYDWPGNVRECSSTRWSGPSPWHARSPPSLPNICRPISG